MGNIYKDKVYICKALDLLKNDKVLISKNTGISIGGLLANKSIYWYDQSINMVVKSKICGNKRIHLTKRILKALSTYHIFNDKEFFYVFLDSLNCNSILKDINSYLSPDSLIRSHFYEEDLIFPQ